MRITRYIRHFLAVTAFGCCALLAPATVPVANTQSVPFTGVVTGENRCTIRIRRQGTLAQSPNGAMLSSRLSGGRSARAIVNTPAAGGRISLFHGAEFMGQNPIIGAHDTTFNTYFSGRALNRGGLTFAEQSGTDPVTIPSRGRTRVTIHLEAIRNSGSFPSGDYATDVTLLCE